jgi:creatinine amidohydrolase
MRLAEMTSREIGRAAPRSVALLPLGSVEQHGPHLPVSTDAAVITALAEAVEGELGDKVVLCPTVPYGYSEHHLDFPGTMSVGIPAYSGLVEDLVRSLVRGGFRRILLLNGHGGNTGPASSALAVLSAGLDDGPGPTIALVSYWEACGRLFEGAPPMATRAMSHACEYETSLVLHLHPEWVRRRLLRQAARSRRNPIINWEGSGPFPGVRIYRKTTHISASGNTGRPDLASPAKGRHLFTGAVRALSAFIGDFHSWRPMRRLGRGRTGR